LPPKFVSERDNLTHYQYIVSSELAADVWWYSDDRSARQH